MMVLALTCRNSIPRNSPEPTCRIVWDREHPDVWDANHVSDVRAEELYNLAGESSVSASFADPRATWESNAHIVVALLDAVRKDSPSTRFYQAFFRDPASPGEQRALETKMAG